MITTLLAAVSLAVAAPPTTPLAQAATACVGANVNESAERGAGAYHIALPAVDPAATLSPDDFGVGAFRPRFEHGWWFAKPLV